MKIIREIIFKNKIIVTCLLCFIIFTYCTSQSPSFVIIFPEFSPNQNRVLVGDELEMKNTSDGSIQSYEWTFVDGKNPSSSDENQSTVYISNEINPKVIYDTIGEKTIKLTVRGNGFEQSIENKVTVYSEIDMSVSPRFLEVSAGEIVKFSVSYNGNPKVINPTFYVTKNLGVINEITDKGQHPEITNPTVSPTYNVAIPPGEDVNRIYKNSTSYNYQMSSLQGVLMKTIIKFKNSDKYDVKSDTLFVLQKSNSNKKFCGVSWNQNVAITGDKNVLESDYIVNNNIYNPDINSIEQSKSITFCSYIISSGVNEVGVIIDKVLWNWNISDTNNSTIFGFPHILYGIEVNKESTNNFRRTTNQSSFPKLISLEENIPAGALNEFKVLFNFEYDNVLTNKQESRIYIDFYFNKKHDNNGNLLTNLNDNSTIWKILNIDKNGIDTDPNLGENVKRAVLRYVIMAGSRRIGVEIPRTGNNTNSETISELVGEQPDVVRYKIFNESFLNDSFDSTPVERITSIYYETANFSRNNEGKDITIDVLEMLRLLKNRPSKIEDITNEMKPTNENENFEFYLYAVKIGTLVKTGTGCVLINKFKVITNTAQN